jgi:hypothetical protein
MFKLFKTKPHVKPLVKLHVWGQWEDTTEKVVSEVGESGSYIRHTTTITTRNIVSQRRRCTVCNKIQRDDELNDKESTQCLT